MTKKRSSKLLSWLLTLAMVLSLAAGMSITAFAQDNDIIVLYTNDVHCGVDDNIGYAGSCALQEADAAADPVCDSGRCRRRNSGSADRHVVRGRLSGRYRNQVGYDFAIPGNHEFDYGMNRFLGACGKLDCGYYSSNFVDLRTGNTVFAPYKMFTFGDVKVALVGASTRRASQNRHRPISRMQTVPMCMDSVRMRAVRACTQRFSLPLTQREMTGQLT